MSTKFKIPALLALLLITGCATPPVEKIPLTDAETEFINSLEDPKARSVKEDIPSLFFRLNQLVKSWRDAATLESSRKNRTLYTNIGAMLTRIVYFNFDKIHDQLENGSQPNRLIAAGALGFSRIPENDRFPQVYQKAITGLLRALESGDDAITGNALLSLSVLGDTSTPVEEVLGLMTQHHNPDVRANAALCLSAIEGLKLYCLESLRKLSGEDFGDDPEKWNQWWTERRHDG